MNNQTLYRRIFKEAWQISAHCKILWIFGVFAALLGSSEGYELLIKGYYKLTTRGIAYDSKDFLVSFFQNFSLDKLSFSWIFASKIIFLIFCLLIIAFLISSAIISQIALIRYTSLIHKGKKITFKEGLSLSPRSFWPVLSINLLSKIIIWFLLFFLTLPLLVILSRENNFFWTTLVFIILFILFTVLSLIIAFIAVYSSIFIILKNYSFFKALSKSWRLFLNNWLISLETAFVLFFVRTLAAFAFILSVLISAVPFLFLLLIFYFLNLESISYLINYLFLVFVFILLLFFGSYLSVFQFSAWTLLFLRLTGIRGALSKLIRFNQKIAKYFKKNK